MKLSRDLKLLSFSLFLWALGEGLFIYILPLYMQSLGANSVQIGALFSFGAVVMAAALIPAGLAVDRFGPRSGLVSGWILGAVAGAIMAAAKDISWFAVGWGLYRLTAWVMPAISSYVTHGRGDMPPERALTAVSSMYQAGLIISPTLGGYIGEHYGLRANFIVGTIIFAVSSISILLISHQAPHPHEHRVRPVELLSNRRFLGFMALIFLIMAGLYVGFDFAPKFLNDVKGINIQQLGWVGTASAVGGFALNQYLGRRPPRRGLILAIGFILCYAAILLRASWVGWFAVGYFLRASYNVARSLVDAMVTRVVSPSQYGVAFAVSETVVTLATAVSPYLAGWLYTASPALPFQITLALAPVAMMLIWFFVPRAVSVEHKPLVVAVSAD